MRGPFGVRHGHPHARTKNVAVGGRGGCRYRIHLEQFDEMPVGIRDDYAVQPVTGTERDRPATGSNDRHARLPERREGLLEIAYRQHERGAAWILGTRKDRFPVRPSELDGLDAESGTWNPED